MNSCNTTQPYEETCISSTANHLKHFGTLAYIWTNLMGPWHYQSGKSFNDLREVIIIGEQDFKNQEKKINCNVFF